MGKERGSKEPKGRGLLCFALDGHSSMGESRNKNHNLLQLTIDTDHDQ